MQKIFLFTICVSDLLALFATLRTVFLFTICVSDLLALFATLRTGNNRSQASATSASSRFGSINLLHHLLLEVMGVEDDAIVIITTNYNREEMDSLLLGATEEKEAHSFEIDHSQVENVK
ncbi:hypothetical protein L1987_51058 [Smallanthus sonchifolius]|uniref:Uncharacterized protein n=1 Tax=Smallanthus sonchifolius TaxID=185202 RepID=A0ACB9EPL1_9ASTR|nr:hypothetical protein L1987_51058 [Smallanthus sonchifolius]